MLCRWLSERQCFRNTRKQVTIRSTLDVCLDLVRYHALSESGVRLWHNNIKNSKEGRHYI